MALTIKIVKDKKNKKEAYPCLKVNTDLNRGEIVLFSEPTVGTVIAIDDGGGAGSAVGYYSRDWDENGCFTKFNGTVVSKNKE